MPVHGTAQHPPLSSSPFRLALDVALFCLSFHSLRCVSVASRSAPMDDWCVLVWGSAAFYVFVVRPVWLRQDPKAINYQRIQPAVEEKPSGPTAVNVIIRADTQGSVDAIQNVLARIPAESVSTGFNRFGGDGDGKRNLPPCV